MLILRAQACIMFLCAHAYVMCLCVVFMQVIMCSCAHVCARVLVFRCLSLFSTSLYLEHLNVCLFVRHDLPCTPICFMSPVIRVSDTSSFVTRCEWGVFSFQQNYESRHIGVVIPNLVCTCTRSSAASTSTSQTPGWSVWMSSWWRSNTTSCLG